MKNAMPEVPGDLSAALKKNATARAAFEKLPPSHRREYIQWITAAKKDETRQKRLAATLDRLCEGSPTNGTSRSRATKSSRNYSHAAD